MTTVDQGYAAWLKAQNLSLEGQGADPIRWPTQGLTASAVSPFATDIGAQAEAVRRAAFLGGPLVRDKAVVLAADRDLIGRCVRLTGTGLAAAGEAVFVIGVIEQDNGSMVLTILRRLT